jgi:hypothetical protein
MPIRTHPDKPRDFSIERLPEVRQALIVEALERRDPASRM